MPIDIVAIISPKAGKADRVRHQHQQPASKLQAKLQANNIN